MAVREISEDKKKADDGRISVNRREFLALVFASASAAALSGELARH